MLRREGDTFRLGTAIFVSLILQIAESFFEVCSQARKSCRAENRPEGGPYASSQAAYQGAIAVGNPKKQLWLSLPEGKAVKLAPIRPYFIQAMFSFKIVTWDIA
ncbi:MAG: hypothetical protein AAGC58_04470 [Asticcacaulis sp.]